MSTFQEAREQITEAEKDFRKTGKSVGAEVDLKALYTRQGWGMNAAPLTKAALKELELVDMTADSRWMPYFTKSKAHLGLYRSNVGCYWLLRYEAGFKQHLLEQIGTALAASKRFAKD
ncbi:MAG: hypothetical protein AAGF12_03895 [Myxococcota bacterium]